jgi:hypothetical protein
MNVVVGEGSCTERRRVSRVAGGNLHFFHQPPKLFRQPPETLGDSRKPCGTWRWAGYPSIVIHLHPRHPTTRDKQAILAPNDRTFFSIRITPHTEPQIQLCQIQECPQVVFQQALGICSKFTIQYGDSGSFVCVIYILRGDGSIQFSHYSFLQTSANLRHCAVFHRYFLRWLLLQDEKVVEHVSG